MFPLQDCPLKSQGCIEGIWALGWTLGLLGPWKHRNSWKGHSATSCVHSFPGRLTHKVGLPSLSECTLRPWEQGRWVIPQSPTWPRVPLGNLSWLWNKEFQVSPGQTGHHTPVTLDGHHTADSAVARHRQALPLSSCSWDWATGSCTFRESCLQLQQLFTFPGICSLVNLCDMACIPTSRKLMAFLFWLT